MTEEHAPLWRRISTFPLDAEGAAVPFSARLSNENRWSPRFAQRVIEEYRRFAFLSVASGHLVSPSDAVDQAWHLHLFYTQNYWSEFCKKALGQPLHHNPSQGGSLETSTYDDAYRQTLESYERLFGEVPPADIWPSPETKQLEHYDYIRVNRASHWVVPKVRSRRSLPYVTGGVLALGLIGCAEGDPLNPFNLDGPGFLVFYLCLMAACITLALAIRYFVRLPGPSDMATMQNLTPLEAACLAGDDVGSLKATVGALAVCGYVKIHPISKSVETINPDATGLDPLAAHIVSDCVGVGGIPLQRLKTATALSLQAIHDRLVQKQLMLGRADRLRAGALAAAIAGAPLVLAIPRMIHGVMVDHPIGFLFALSCVTVGTAGAFAINAPRRTLRGDAVLRRQREIRAGLRNAANSMQPTMPDATLAIGLFGLAVVPLALQSDMTSLLAMQYSGYSSGSCSGSSGCGSSGCGGGGCGGGCGG